MPARGLRTLAGVGAALLLSVGAASAQQPGWQEIGPFDVGGRVSAIALNPSNADHAIVGTPAGGLWKTTDGGGTWTAMTLWLATVPISAIAIDPMNADRIYLGTGTISDAGSVAAGAGVIATTSGGVSWEMHDTGIAGGFISSILLWPGEPQRVLIATDLGIRISLDGGASYSAALEGQAISAMAADPFDPNVAFATGRIGLFRTDDRGLSWTLVNAWPLLPDDDYGAGTTALALSQTTPGVLYASVQVLATFDQTDRALLLRSSDWGETLTTLAPPAGFCPAAESCGFAHALAADPADGSTLLLGGERLFRSSDGGDSWTELAPPLPGVHQIEVIGSRTMVVGRFGAATVDAGWSATTRRNTGLAITAVTSVDVSQTDAPQIAIGTADSGLAISPADTPLWRVSFAADEPVGPARFDPFDGTRLIASRTRGRLFRSIDAGDTFAPAQDGLDLSQPALAFAPLAPSTVQPGAWYAGRMQLFSSTDGGSAWSGIRPPGFPEISIIAASPVDGDRIYFSAGGGSDLYKADGIHTDLLHVTDEPNLFMTSLFLDPAAENVLYVGGLNAAQQSGRVYKSSNFGLTWLDITPPGISPVTSVLKDHYGALYAGTRDRVWRSANDGFSWTPFMKGMLAGGVSVLHRANAWLYAGTNGRGLFRVRELPLFSIESIPDRVRFLVDGQEVVGPYFAYGEPGSVHTISPLLTNTADTREEFLGWMDGAPQDRTVTAADSNVWLMASLKRSFRLTATTKPAPGGAVEFAPSSPDNFYPERTFVTVIPVPVADHRIAGFGGDVSGDDGLLAFAVMDRPRSIEARFEPLEMTVQADHAGIELAVDGAAVVSPATFRWNNGSVHTLSAPEFIGSSLYDPVLTFDSWSNLQSRSHSIQVTRDTFITDFTARYIDTVRGVRVQPGGATFVTTTGTTDAPRMASMTQVPDGSTIRPVLLEFVRGRVGVTTSEFALVPSAAQSWINVKVDQDRDGSAGRLRLAMFNPGTGPASVGLLLRDSNGNAQAAQFDAVTLGPGVHTVEWLDELMPLPAVFSSLLTVISSQPIVASLHAVRGNFRTATFTSDPIMLVPFIQGDYGVPQDARVQTAILTADTTHRLTIINNGFSRLSGVVDFRDAAGESIQLDLAQGPASSVAYDLQPGAFLPLVFNTPAEAAGALPTLQLLVTPTAGQPAPALQMQEEQIVGSVDGAPTVLPRSVPPSIAGQSFAVPVHRGRRETGLVFTNTSPFPVTLAARVLGLDGLQRRVETQTVTPFAQISLSSNTLAAPLGPAFTGQIVVDTDIPIHAVGYLRLINERGEEIVAGYPAVTDREPPATTALAVDGDSWRSEWWFVNRGATAVNSQLEFRGRQAAVMHFPIE